MDIKTLIQKISRGTVEVINPELLEKKLTRSLKDRKPLCIKAGFDPTAPDIHLGHVVLLRKLRQFQDLGHVVYFLIGDFTAQIGDPTGRDQTRPKLDQKKIQENAKTYKSQVFKILDPKKTKVVFNSHWLSKLSAQDILSLASCSTVAQTLARADFKKRWEEQKEITLLEFFYPLLQGYDSVHLKADVELGGSDQKFNLLMGRQLQEAYGQEPQVVMMTPLLEGLDGVQKMSKSLNNYIGINEPPKEIFGKVMSISDELMAKYYEYLTDIDLQKIKGLHPKEAKMMLAEEIVAQFYSREDAQAERTNFEKVFSQKELPDDITEYPLIAGKEEALVDILVAVGTAGSRNEARRLLKQGAVSFNGQKVAEDTWVPQPGVLKVGKRRFLKFVKK
ncbi:MAG: tyrosine--tRNA ligase [Candidatus Omnitrophica bacterium]|nr:tyrosine--tRNA ligase [Candidatus Omnitrophota bacterium]